MTIALGPNRYGKAETRVVRVERRDGQHVLTDLNVTIALAGDLAASFLDGDNHQVLPTDTQRNTVYVFAKEFGIGQIEDFGLRLARHFVDTQPAIEHATVSIDEYQWVRLGPHSFRRGGAETKTASVQYDGTRTEVISGLTGLTLLNSTGSEFRNFARDRYTTLPDSTDRILATAITARWRHLGTDTDWRASYQTVRQVLVEAFCDTYSRSIQQTLYTMGRRVLDRRPELADVRLSLPNRHHLEVDLSAFGLANQGEVFLPLDQPYGLIEGTVVRSGAPPAMESAWST